VESSLFGIHDRCISPPRLHKKPRIAIIVEIVLKFNPRGRSHFPWQL
jgi:hypothetical protein